MLLLLVLVLSAAVLVLSAAVLVLEFFVADRHAQVTSNVMVTGDWTAASLITALRFDVKLLFRARAPLR